MKKIFDNSYQSNEDKIIQKIKQRVSPKIWYKFFCYFNQKPIGDSFNSVLLPKVNRKIT